MLNNPYFFTEPEYGGIIDDVYYHPFNTYLIRMLRPKVVVTIAPEKTGSYLAYCQALTYFNLSAKCYGVTNIAEGYLSDAFKNYHDSTYSRISKLIDRNDLIIDLPVFLGNVDLLHIADLAGWENLSQLINSWMPRLSDKACIVIEGTSQGNFSYELGTLNIRFPSVTYQFDKPLSCLRIGENPNSETVKFFNMAEAEHKTTETTFIQFGRLLSSISRLKKELIVYENLLRDNAVTINKLERTLASSSCELKEIYKSKSWKLALLFRNIRVKIIPPNSLTLKLYKLFQKIIWVWKNEGYINVIKAIIRKTNIFVKKSIIGQISPIISPEVTPIVSPNFSLPDLNTWYSNWIRENEPTRQELDIQRRESINFKARPLISILTPVYNPPVDILIRTIESVLNQTYDQWELCLVNGDSSNEGVSSVIEKYTRIDPRIKQSATTMNLGISGNTNLALEMATGEYVTLLDHDDTLTPFALFEIASYINRHPEIEIIYGDEDRIDVNDGRRSPFFKPDWSPDLLQAFMYVGHCTYSKKLVDNLHGFRSEFDYSQDYDFVLRATEIIKNIGHIPKILYHWRMLPESAAAGGKDFARTSNLVALEHSIKRRGYKAEIIELPTSNCVKFYMDQSPLISIIIPTDNEYNATTCIQSIFDTTNYQNYEIILVINSLEGAKVEARYIDETRLKIIFYDKPYNFSAKCNEGVNASRGEFVLFMNDDVFPISPDWLDWMAGPMQQEGVGAVAPKLIYPNGTTQHAGLVCGVRGFFGTAFHTFFQESGFYFNLLQSPRTVSALSAACMIMRKDVFTQINGFDEINTPIMHSDLDLCFKIRDLGLRLVYTPYTTLKHIGHNSIGKIEENLSGHSEKVDLFMVKRWSEYVDYDPYYPPNMRDYLYIDSLTPIRTSLGKQGLKKDNQEDILIQSHELTFSGAPIIAYRVAALLNKNNYFVTVISPESGELLGEYQKENIPLIIDPLILTDPSRLFTLLRNYDAVIANTIHAWKLVNYAKEIGKKVIWHIHESNYGCELADSNPLIQKALTQADLVVFPSLQTLNKYKRFEILNNFIEIPHGIDDPQASAKKDPKESTDLLKIVIVGSIEPRKGQDILINAINYLPEETQQKFEFNIVGRPLISSYYETLLSKTRSLQFVNWIGHVSPSRALQLISENDILLCTSRDETGPLVVLEAMGLGKPVLSTRVGYVPEIVENGKNGFLFSGEDGIELANILISIDQNRSQITNLGQNARLTYNEKLKIETFYQLFLEQTKIILDELPATEIDKSKNLVGA